MCITLTFLIYHFLLYSAWNDGSGGIDIWSAGNYIVHYIIPAITIIDFFIFDKRAERLKWYAPFVWLIIPLIYFIYILLRALFFGNIGNTQSPYPYPFIDFTIQPVSSVLLNIAGIVIVFVLIGYIFMGIDSLIIKTRKDKP